jgi:hypothetical protein
LQGKKESLKNIAIAKFTFLILFDYSIGKCQTYLYTLVAMETKILQKKKKQYLGPSCKCSELLK